MRLSKWMRIILLVEVVGSAALIFSCYYVGMQLNQAQYIVLDFPTQEFSADWTSENHILHNQKSSYFVWQRIGTFDSASAADVSDELSEWITEQGWVENSYLDGFGMAKFDPCQETDENATETQCRYYMRTDGSSSTLCGFNLAALYTEYRPGLQQGRVVITTITMSDLHMMACGLNHL